VTARIQLPRQAMRGEVIEVRILIQHAMETGFRHDGEGRVVPRNAIYALSCRYNGVEIFRADLSSGISANPYLQFYTLAEASGEIEFSWVDEQGKRETQRASIVVAG